MVERSFYHCLTDSGYFYIHLRCTRSHFHMVLTGVLLLSGMELSRNFSLGHGLFCGDTCASLFNCSTLSSSAAGNAFCQAAKLHMQLQSKHDSATSFVDAGNAYKKADPQGKTHLCLDSDFQPVCRGMLVCHKNF